MAFLISGDYDFLIQDDIYQVITDNDDNIRDKSERAAMEEMKSYLKSRYDLPKIFVDVLPYNNTATFAAGSIVEYNTGTMVLYSPAANYVLGDVVKYNGGFGMRTYLCQQNCTGINPEDTQYFKRVTATYTAKQNTTSIAPPDREYWSEGDSRNAMIIMFLIDIVLYHVHARISPQNIPQVRITRYERAIEYLKDVQKGNIVPDLPALTDNSGNEISNEIQFNSYPKLRYPK